MTKHPDEAIHGTGLQQAAASVPAQAASNAALFAPDPRAGSSARGGSQGQLTPAPQGADATALTPAAPSGPSRTILDICPLKNRK